MLNLNKLLLFAIVLLTFSACQKHRGTVVIEEETIMETPNDEELSNVQIATQGAELARAKNALASTINSFFSGILIAAPEQLVNSPLNLPFSCPTNTSTQNNLGETLLIDYGNFDVDGCMLPSGAQVGGQIKISAPSPIPGANCPPDCPGLQDANLARPAFFQFETPFQLNNMTITEDRGSNANNRPKFFKVSQDPLIFFFRVGGSYHWDVYDEKTATTTKIDFIKSDANFMEVKVDNINLDDLDYASLINSKYKIKLGNECTQAPIYNQVELEDGNGGTTPYNILTLTDLEFDFVGCDNLKSGELMYFPGNFIDCNKPTNNDYNFITFGVDANGAVTNTCTEYVKVRTNCNLFGGNCAYEAVLSL